MAAAADRLSRRLHGYAPLAADPQALVWLAVLSLFTRIGVESLRFESWTWAGFPPNELARYVCLGWLFAAELPLWVGVRGLLAGFLDERRRTPGRAARLAAALGGAGCLATAFALPRVGAGGWSASLAVAGAWLALEAWRTSGLLSGAARSQALAAAIVLVAGEALQPLLAARRFYNVGFDDPHLFDAPLRLLPALACAPLAMRAAYGLAAEALGLPQTPEAKDSVKSAKDG